MKRFLPWLIALIFVAGLCGVFPPFRVHSLKAVREVQASQQFNAADFVGRFWGEKLLPATEQAAEVTQVLAAVANSPGQVREQFGRTVGVSSSYFLFVRGAGRVVSMTEDSIGLAVKPGAMGRKSSCRWDLCSATPSSSWRWRWTKWEARRTEKTL